MGRTFTPTGEQQAIIDAFGRELRAPGGTRRHLIVNAGAGTGKTTTLRMMADSQPRARGLYLAFNKSVADAAQEVFGPHVECRTSHSLAFRHLGRSEHSALLDKIKSGPQRDDRLAIAKDFRMLGRRVVVGERRTSGVSDRVVGGMQLVSIALDVITRFCQTAAREPSAAHVVAPRNFVPANFEEFRKAVWGEVERLVHALWADLLEPHGKYMKFRHDTYLKLYGLSAPVLDYDFILLDEAQDTAPVTEDIVTRQSSHALLVMVGDPSQAIYGFTGARDSMTRFENSGMTTESLTLSESWRFGPEIADAANALLACTERSMRIVGRGFPDSEVLHHLSDAVNGVPHVYVCRTNFDVIEASLEAIAQGMRVDTTSVDLSEVEAFLEGAAELKAGRATSRGGLKPYSRWEEFELDYEDGVPMTEGQRVGMMLLEKYETTAASLEKIGRIRSGSATPREADVKVITIHKAKGGEWTDVSVRYDAAFRKVRDKDIPERFVWEVSDPHLSYVAVTRAIEALDPGALWPLVEYGIVCDGGTLLSRARGFYGTLRDSEVASLLRADTPELVERFARRRSSQIAQMLDDMGVERADDGVVGFVSLLSAIARAANRRSVTAEEATSVAGLDAEGAATPHHAGESLVLFDA